MESEQNSYTLMDGILESGPLVILAWVLLAAITLYLAGCLIKGLFKREPIGSAGYFLPVPAILGLWITVLSIVVGLPVRDSLSGIADYPPLGTTLSHMSKSALVGTSSSLALSLLALVQSRAARGKSR